MNITREQLKGVYGEEDALAIYGEVKNGKDFVGFAQRFMNDSDCLVARNALWIMTKATDEELAHLQPLSNSLIDLAMATDYSSVRRLSLNVAYRLRLDVDDLRADFFDFCIAHMVDPNEYPGIQTLCMKHAYRISAFYPDLMGELLRTVETMNIDFYKPAVKALRNKILAGKKI